MISKLSILLVVLSASFTAAGAVTLQPIPEPKAVELPLQSGQPAIPCDQIVPRLEKYQQMVSSHETSLTSFLNDVSAKVAGWYEQLAPLEGTQQTIVPDTFLPLKDGADKIGTLSNMAYDNTDLLTGEIQLIVSSLRACSITAPQAPLK